MSGEDRLDAADRTSNLLGIDDRDRSVGLLFSTADLDLDDEVVEQSWVLDRFLKNPVVLWSHDASKLPIGKVTELSVTPQGLAGRIKFATERANPEAERVYQAVREGIVRAASVRFRPRSRMPEEREGRLVQVLSANELLEVSLTPVPSNPNTVVEDRESPEYRTAKISHAGKLLRSARPTATKTDSDETVLRLDGGRLGKAERTPQGGIRVPARVTRTGILRYRLPDGSIRRELRTPEEVFRPESLATLKSAPVTDHHPPFGHVTPETWKQVTVGHVEVARQDSKYVEAALVIQDAAQIEKIDSGARQDISAGYRCIVKMAPGVWNGEPYDAVQTSITYNHVALLPKGGGRAGVDVGLRLDSGDAVLCDDPFIDGDHQEPMVIKIDGKDFEYGSKEHLEKIDSLHQTEVQTLKTELATAKSDLDKATARADAATQEVTKLQGEVTKLSDPAAVTSKVNARVDLLVKAKSILGESAKLDGTDRELMISCIKADDANFTGEGKSDDYVTARFDVVSSKGVRSDSIHSVVKFAEGLKTDAKDPVSSALREAEKRKNEAWKQPLANTKA
jgi:HK97 family phage prohead protease